MDHHIHTIPVDNSLTIDEAWKEICTMGFRATYTGGETWASVECDGEECQGILEELDGYTGRTPTT
jgi:hypothetical protein